MSEIFSSIDPAVGDAALVTLRLQAQKNNAGTPGSPLLVHQTSTFKTGAYEMDAAKSEQFTTLWTAAQPTITAYIRTLVPDFQQAEEVLQRVAIALLRKFDQYDAQRSFGAWAVGVAKYEVLYYRRQHATDRHVFNDELVEQLSLSYEQFLVEADPFREALEICLDELHGRPKEAVTLKYEQGLGSATIADRLRMSTGAVRILLWRTRTALRECVERKTGAAPAE